MQLKNSLTFPDDTVQSTAGLQPGNNLSEITDFNLARSALRFYSASSFPTASTGMRVVRTDLGYMEFINDGTRWISLARSVLPFTYYPSGGGITDLSSGTIEQWFLALPSDMAFRIERAVFLWFNFGTNNGSNYWKFVIRTFPGSVNLQTTPVNTSAGSAGTWSRVESTTWNTQPSTSDFGLEILPTAQGTPGSIRLTMATLIGRWVAT